MIWRSQQHGYHLMGSWQTSPWGAQQVDDLNVATVLAAAGGVDGVGRENDLRTRQA